MVMTRAQFARDLQDGINAHFGMSYDEHETEYTKIFNKRTSKRAYEEMVLRVGLGEAVEKPEGGMITFDAGGEGYVTRVDFYTYSLAFAITEEAIDDNLYADLSEVYGKELGKSLQHAKEVRGANIINNAMNASFTGGDGKTLAAIDHPLWGGGAFSNTFSTPADISEEALEDAHIQIGGFVNDRGQGQEGPDPPAAGVHPPAHPDQHEARRHQPERPERAEGGELRPRLVRQPLPGRPRRMGPDH
jgi:hypothetical protein